MSGIKLLERTGWVGLVRSRVWRHHCLECAEATGRLGWRGWLHGVPALLVADCEARNVITTAGLNFMRDTLEDTSTDSGIRYMAWGNGSTAPAAGDTTLVSEDGRKVITSWADPGTGQKTTTVFLATDEANQTIEEFGWFATSTAGAGANTGVLIARVLYPGGAHTKTALESIQVDRTDTFS